MLKSFATRSAENDESMRAATSAYEEALRSDFDLAERVPSAPAGDAPEVDGESGPATKAAEPA